MHVKRQVRQENRMCADLFWYRDNIFLQDGYTKVLLHPNGGF